MIDERYFKPYEVAVLPLLIDQFQWEKASRRSDAAQACPEWASKVDTEEGTQTAWRQEGFKNELGLLDKVQKSTSSAQCYGQT